MITELLAGTGLAVLTYLTLRRFGPDPTSTAAWVVIVAGFFLRGIFRGLAQTYPWYSLMAFIVLGAQCWAVVTLYRRWRVRKTGAAALRAPETRGR